MLQCQNCEFFESLPDGSVRFHCDPFRNIKEPECLVKWQLLKLDVLVRSHQATLAMYERLGPLQERMMRHMERELREADDADRWKHDEDDEDDGDGEREPGFDADDEDDDAR
jgi:hypothetical protein